MLDLGLNPGAGQSLGRENEERLYCLLQGIVGALLTYPSVLRADCRRTPQYSLLDRHGEDASIFLAVQTEDGQKSGRVVYDSKSSLGGVERYYKRGKDRQRSCHGQKDCLLRKAILISPDREDNEIEREILTDLVSAGLLSLSVVDWYRRAVTIKAVA